MDTIYLVPQKKLGKISEDLYGVFAEHIGGVIYDGIWVGEDSKAENIRGFRKKIIDKLKEADIRLIRWPGGCFAELYDWRDGIGPVEDRPVRINVWTKRDGRYEPNRVGTDEFLDFCELCEAKPYIAANITTTTPLDIVEWIDYCNSPADTTTLAKLREKNGRREPYNVKLWGVGNETWGGGGNMTPQTYAMEYRRYSEVMHDMAHGLELIGSGANCFDYSWTRGFLDVFQSSSKHMSGLSFHYYCGAAGDPLAFTTEEWYQLLGKASRMQELIERHYAAAVGYGLEKYAKLCIDEWGCWHPEGSGPSKGFNLFEQQSTMRDAMVTALTLNIFNNNCEKIRLATVAQLVNNLHALFLSGGEICICTPTYHVFDLFKNHHGGEAIEAIADAPSAGGLPGLSVSASKKDGKLTVTAANLSADRDTEVMLKPFGGHFGKAVIRTLAHDDIHACNTFEEPERVKPVDRTVEDFNGVLVLPHGSVVSVTADMAE